MTRRAGVLTALAACLLLAGCDSPEQRACLAAQRRAEHHYGTLWAWLTVGVALALSLYLVFGRTGLRPGPRHGLRLTATVGALGLAALIVGLLGYVGGTLYADHVHPCDDALSFSGNGVVLLVLLLIAAPLAAFTLLAVAMIGLARTVYAGVRSSVIAAAAVAFFPGFGAVSSLDDDGGSPYAWALALTSAAVVLPCVALAVTPQQQAPAPEQPPPAAEHSRPGPRPRPGPGAPH